MQYLCTGPASRQFAGGGRVQVPYRLEFGAVQRPCLKLKPSLPDVKRDSTIPAAPLTKTYLSPFSAALILRLLKESMSLSPMHQETAAANDFQASTLRPRKPSMRRDASQLSTNWVALDTRTRLCQRQKCICTYISMPCHRTSTQHFSANAYEYVSLIAQFIPFFPAAFGFAGRIQYDVAL